MSVTKVESYIELKPGDELFLDDLIVGELRERSSEGLEVDWGDFDSGILEGTDVQYFLTWRPEVVAVRITDDE